MGNRTVRRAVRMKRTKPKDVYIDFNCREGNYSTFMNELRGMLAAHQERTFQEHLKHVYPFLAQHPLLPSQRPKLPARWINIKLVGNNGEETTLRIRDDNVYLKAFKARNGKWYEFGLSAADEKKRSVALIPESTFLECDDDYGSILGGARSFPELKLGERQLGKEFAIEAIRLLSNYNKEKIDDDTKKALAGLIFMFCESARMYPHYHKVKEYWRQGGYTVEICMVKFLWNWGNMSRFLMDWMKNPQREKVLWDIGIRNKDDALEVVHLVLHSPLGQSPEHQSKQQPQQQQPPSSEGQGEPQMPAGPGESGTQHQNPSPSPTQNGRRHEQQPPPAGGHGRRHEQQPPSPEGHGRPLVEVFAVRANFCVVGTIAVFDGKRGQVIYEDHPQYAHLDNRTEFEDLVLTGPYRAISAEGGSIAIEVDLSPPAGSEANGANLWKLEYKADEADSLIQATISVDDDDKEIQVMYAVLINAVEARVQVNLSFDESDGIKFSGQITAGSRLLKDASVLLFSGEAVTSYGSMVPLQRSVVAAPLCSELLINVNLKATCPTDNENVISFDGTLDFSLLEQDTKEIEGNGMVVKVKITLPDIVAEEIDTNLPEGATGSYPAPAPTTTSEIDTMLLEGATGSNPALEEICPALSPSQRPEGGFPVHNIPTDSGESHKVDMEALVGAVSTGELQALLIPKLGNMLADEYKLHKGAKEGISYIREELQSMQVALHKVSEVPPDQLDPQVKLWARKVRDMSYKIEDTVDSYMVTVNPSAAAHQSESSPSTSTWWDSHIRGMLSPRKIKARRDIATEIERIRKEVKEVAERRRMYKLDDIAPPAPSDPRLPALYQDELKLVGIDHSTEQIMELLSMQLDQAGSTSSSEEKKMLRLVSIVGPGGMGKTTLANVVYQKLKDNFDCTAFVSVSLKPNIENILGSILRQVNSTTNDVSKAKAKSILRQESRRNHGNADNWSKMEIIDKIREVLEDKRYLIVIDDIWDQPSWELLKCALVPNRLGSTIITTTRNINVAKLCYSCDSNVVGTTHQLEPLSEAESEELFYCKVFGTGKCSPEFKDISSKILGNCKGLPLAIVSIAGLLANKTKDQWVRIYNSIYTGLESSRGVKDMRLILSLSYCDMSFQLRACFLYLSMFPKDHVIGRDDLIWRWIAEGFVHGKQDGDSNSSLYEVGDEYFNELINKNMIQPADVDTIGRAQACIVHDVVLDFINFLSAKEGFVTILNGQPFPSQRDSIHRLSLQNSYGEQGVPERLPHVRTLVMSSQAATSMPSLSIFPLLRVLDLEVCTSHNIKDVGFLVLLRYLKLSQAYHGYDHIKLPRQIGALKFLQILDLKDARIQGLPATLVQLIQLRVLKLSLHSWDKRYEKRLIQCLCNLKKLQALYISAAANVSLDFMLSVDLDTPYLRRFTARFQEQNEHILRPGSVWRELSSFSTLPRWINSSLSSLSDLSIVVRKLQQRDVEILAQFPILVTLDLEVVQACEEGKRLVISGDERAFRCLSNLKFASRALGLLFIPGAMQKLQKLYLCFSLARTKDVHFNEKDEGDFHFGLENLTSLKAVEVEIDCRCAWRRELEAAEAALRTNQLDFDLRKHFEREMLSEAVFSEHEGSSRGVVEEEPSGLSRIGPYGGIGGGSCDIPVPPHHLETVTIRSGDVVNSLAFSYSDHNGQQRNAGPWGGRDGGSFTFHLGPSEYLTQVSGTTGSFNGLHVVRSLTFVTNVTSYGPFGINDGENQFVIQARRNSCIVGFFGHSGLLVDSIGFYTRPL